MMKRLPSIFPVWLLACLPLLAAEELVEDTGNNIEQPVTVVETETPEPDNGLTPPPSDDPESEDFVPSIRITEDLPVSFPVDI